MALLCLAGVERQPERPRALPPSQNAMSQDVVDTRCHDIVDRLHHFIVDTVSRLRWFSGGMSNSLPSRTRALIINYDPGQPHALSISAFCKSLKVSRSVFYKIRGLAARDKVAALHPRSRAPQQPARRYGATVVNELVRIRKQLKADGWDYGPKSIHHEASILDSFPGGTVPSVATIARLLASVGQVDAAPRKRPRSSYVPFMRATAMALWQLDAFEYRLASGETATVYQLLDDATRYDVGTWAYARKENSSDAKDVLERAINEYGAPMELLSDNSHAFNQLRRGSIGAVEVFLVKGHPGSRSWGTSTFPRSWLVIGWWPGLPSV